ncbi:MAG: hypothetical protein JSS89_09815 [Bacteroidetes bacterium]|nr:hypothetical protein [Bacteroidota bacterium]
MLAVVSVLLLFASSVSTFANGEVQIVDTAWTNSVVRKGTRIVAMNGSVVVRAGADSVVRIFDGAFGNELSSFKAYTYPNQGYCNMASGNLHVTETGKYVVMLRYFEVEGKVKEELIVHDTYAKRTLRKPLPEADRTILLATDKLNQVFVWMKSGGPIVYDLQTLDSLGQFPVLQGASRIEVMPDSLLFAFGQFDLGSSGKFQGAVIFNVGKDSIVRKIPMRNGYVRLVGSKKAYVFANDGEPSGNTYSYDLQSGVERFLSINVSLPTTYLSADSRYMTVTGRNQHFRVHTQTDDFSLCYRTLDVEPYDIGQGDMMADGQVLYAEKFTPTSFRLCRFNLSNVTTVGSGAGDLTSNIIVQSSPGLIVAHTSDNSPIVQAQLFASQGSLAAQANHSAESLSVVQITTETLTAGLYILRIIQVHGNCDRLIFISK